MEIIKTHELPARPAEGQIFEIIPDKSRVVSSTNRLFNKYPTRYISAVPRHAILHYSKANDFVLDPFCGSGTTAVEAMLHGRNALSIDIDPFARLLTKVKTSVFDAGDLRLIEGCVKRLAERRPAARDTYPLPDIPNIGKWFNERSILELSYLSRYIRQLTFGNEKVQDYLLVVMAAIIRRCSNAENVSPKPYISTRFPKVPAAPIESFLHTEIVYRKAVEEFSETAGQYPCTSSILTGNDARHFRLGPGKKVSLAVTSPPYMNAYDYARSLRFEDLWLGLISSSELAKSRKKYIGTETAASFYQEFPFALQSGLLREIAPQIECTDKKRAGMVLTYFEDMAKNICAVRDVLETGGHYIIVVGDSTIRGQNIPTSRIFTEIASKNGFAYERGFKYIIRDRYLHLPRGNRGGIIKYDEIIVLKKRSAPCSFTAE